MKTLADAPVLTWKMYLTVGRYHARRAGLDHDAAEDCAMEFVVKMLRHPLAETTSFSPKQQQAWLHQCARNHTCDACRAQARRKYREGISWNALTEKQVVTTLRCNNAPLECLIQAEKGEQILLALSELEPRQRKILLRHHCAKERVEQIADDHGQSAGAVKQALSCARKRLKTLLYADGTGNGERKVTNFDRIPSGVYALQKQVSDQYGTTENNYEESEKFS